MNPADRIEALLTHVVMQNHNLQTLLTGLPFALVKAAGSPADRDSLANSYVSYITDQRAMVDLILGVVARGGEEHRTAEHEAKAVEDNQRLNEIYREMLKNPIGFRVP